MNPKQIYKLAIKVIERDRRIRYAVAAGAINTGFEFAINAKKHYDEYTEAIEFFQEKLNFLNENNENFEMMVKHEGKAKPFVPRDYKREIEE